MKIVCSARRSVAAVSVLAIAVLAACGGPPAAPATPAAPSKPSAPPADSSSASPVASAPAPEPKTEPAPAATSSNEMKLSQKPRDMITAADVMFLLSFENSEAGKAAEQKCGSSANEDVKRACMTKSREKITSDAVRFKKDQLGNWWWHTWQKRAEQLTLLHRVMVDFGEETDHSIVLKPKGKDQGMTPFVNTPRELKIEIPNDFTIIIQDPQFGKLVYEAKIGIAGK